MTIARPASERFWERFTVGAPDECWEWQGARHPQGHGSLANGKGKRIYAHRLSYMLHKGPIPDGLVIHHTCFNPPCVNPDHLEAVTHGENLRAGPRGPAYERVRRTHCPKGHEYTPENTLPPKSGSWGRECRECARLRAKRNYAARKAREAA